MVMIFSFDHMTDENCQLEFRVLDLLLLFYFIFFFQFVAWTTARLNPKRGFMVEEKPFKSIRCLTILFRV